MRRRALTVLAGCGGTDEAQRSVEDDTLVLALPSQPENLNPIASVNVYEGNPPFFNGLLRYAKDLTPMPDLAAGMPTPSADGLRIVVRLRDGVRFHDGKPLTAEDVAFTYNAIHARTRPRRCPRCSIRCSRRARPRPSRSSSGSSASTRRSTTSSRSGSSRRTYSRARTSRPPRSTAGRSARART